MDAKPVLAHLATRSARRPALDLAAQSASTSYKTNLPPEVLGKALRTGTLPADFAPHIGTLLDEAPMSMLAKAVEQIHADDGVPQDLVWSNMRDLARSLKLTRELGPHNHALRAIVDNLSSPPPGGQIGFVDGGLPLADRPFSERTWP